MRYCTSFIFTVAASAVFASGLSQAHAQKYPAHPVRLVVPYPPGGPTDVQARIVAQRLSERLGQQMIVDNRGGAGGRLGSDLVAKASPDGYTLLMGASGPQAIGPHLLVKPPYDAIRDFTAITLVSYSPMMLVVHPSVKANSVSELIAFAKANPGKLTFGSYGPGTMAQLAGELFKTMAAIDIVHVPYKGSAPAMADLLGGQISMMFDTVITSLPHVKAGKLRALAVTGKKHSEAVPDLPTVAEAGLPGFEAVSWIGLMGPRGLPPEITKRLNSETVAILRDPQVRQRLITSGAEPAETTAAEFGALMQSELKKWGTVVKTAGLTPS